jgi:hypothetical protein
VNTHNDLPITFDTVIAELKKEKLEPRIVHIFKFPIWYFPDGNLMPVKLPIGLLKQHKWKHMTNFSETNTSGQYWLTKSENRFLQNFKVKKLNNGYYWRLPNGKYERILLPKHQPAGST